MLLVQHGSVATASLHCLTVPQVVETLPSYTRTIWSTWSLWSSWQRTGERDSVFTCHMYIPSRGRTFPSLPQVPRCAPLFSSPLLLPLSLRQRQSLSNFHCHTLLLPILEFPRKESLQYAPLCLMSFVQHNGFEIHHCISAGCFLNCSRITQINLSQTDHMLVSRVAWRMMLTLGQS